MDYRYSYKVSLLNNMDVIGDGRNFSAAVFFPLLEICHLHYIFNEVNQLQK